MPTSPRAEGRGTNQGNSPTSAPVVHTAAARGISGSSHALPYAESIQPLFGDHDLSQVRAHTDESATAATRAMGAKAFATGDHVVFGSAPDLHTAAHEVAHVVQQRAGVHLKDGVGQAGDSHERNADEVADRVVQGLPAHDLLPAPAKLGLGAPQHAIQRQGGSEMDDAQLQAARDWARDSGIGIETILEVQRFCGAAATGTYDDRTAQAVFAKQQELGLAGPDGKADREFCWEAGLIFTETITAATVTDPMLRQVENLYPDGVTVAIYPNYDLTETGDGAEFQRQADRFAQNQRAVGKSGAGAVELDISCGINELGDIIEVVQSIHRGLLQKWTASQGPRAEVEATSAVESPAFTKVRNLALFAHGRPWGMGLNTGNDMTHDGLHDDGPHPDDPFGYTAEGLRPSNVEAFVRGLSAAVVPDVRVLLFGCDAGQGADGEDTYRANFAESRLQEQHSRTGIGSLAASLAGAFGEGSTVIAHTTFGHTTENPGARVFGAEAGGGTGGIPLFDLMYPDDYISSQLEEHFHPTEENRDALYASLRQEMWLHYYDSIYTEHHNRDESTRRYPVPMGQETFVNPDNARELLHEDWETFWLPGHTDRVRAG